jgi:hypothetical protein
MMPPIAKIDSTARRSYPYGRAEAALAIKDLGVCGLLIIQPHGWITLTTADEKLTLASR